MIIYNNITSLGRSHSITPRRHIGSNALYVAPAAGAKGQTKSARIGMRLNQLLDGA